MWELDHKQSQVPKNWCFYTVELEKTLENPLVSMEIKPVNPKGNQPWLFIGRTDAEAPILWPPEAKSQLIGRPWCWERLKAKGEKGGRGWDGYMASLIQWTCTWVNSGRWWETGRPGVLQSLRSQRDGQRSKDWTTTKGFQLFHLPILFKAPVKWK